MPELEPDSDAVLESWTTTVPTTPWAPDATFATISVSSQTRPVLSAGGRYWVVLSTRQPGASVAWVTHPVWVPNPGPRPLPGLRSEAAYLLTPPTSFGLPMDPSPPRAARCR